MSSCNACTQRGTNAEWVMVLPPRTCNVQMGELKQDKQSTVHINLITADGLWDMDWENSIYIEKHGEVKGTPGGQNGAPKMVCRTYQRVIFTGKKRHRPHHQCHSRLFMDGRMWGCSVSYAHRAHGGCAKVCAKRGKKTIIGPHSGWTLQPVF